VPSEMVEFLLRLLLKQNSCCVSQWCTGAGVSEWITAGILTNFENKTGVHPVLIF